MDRELPPRLQHARACFEQACRLDVMVRKPGNVSVASPGHRMSAGQFIASAQAAAGPLFTPGARIGERIERAVEATWAAVGCNTNLGIVLLAAPIAAAIEHPGDLRDSVHTVLAGLDLDDSRAAFRAIARANPGGLGSAAAQDVHAAPTLGLRDAMALAAGRDSIARQYANGFADLFDIGLPQFTGQSVLPAAEGPVDAATAAATQRVFLEFLGRFPDSHIVRKHGEAVAQTVIDAAQGWRGLAAPESDPRFAAWDDSLKVRGINPGTSADLTVATLLLALLAGPSFRPWHGS